MASLRVTVTRLHRLARPIGAAALVVCVLAAVLRAETRVSFPYAGVTYLDRTESAPRPWHAHVVQVDLTTPGVRVELPAPAGALEMRRQTTREFLAARGAQVAINAHFFLPWPSTEPDADTVGIGVSEGRVFSAFETPSQSYALVANAPGLNINPANHATIVHRDPSDVSGRRVVESVQLWTTVSGSAQIVTDGEVSIPAYADATHPEALLTPGGPNGYSNDKSWYAALNARSAIGVSRDGRTLTLFTVDVRGGSAGMTVREVAEVLVRDYGVWQAINLDGGGSTSLALADPFTGEATLMNASSDNPGGRAVATSLAVFAPKRP